MSVSDEKIKNLLERIGLSEKEAAVYLAALKLGETTVMAISKKSEVKRSTVYTIIDDLKRRGIMAEVHKGLKKKFVAENPRNLLQIVEDNRERLQKYLPDLMNMYSFPSTDQGVKVLEGAEGVRNGLESMLSDIEVGDYYLVMVNFETLFELLPNFMPKFLAKRATYNINIRTIVQDGERGRWYKSNQEKFNDTVKIFPKDVQFSANIVLTPHRVLFKKLLPDTGAVIIENRQVVDTIKQVFEMVWGGIPDTPSSVPPEK